MSERYSRHLVNRLSMDEKSRLLGCDYREFVQAGGTANDIYQIINRHKTLEDVTGFAPNEPQGELSDEQIRVIERRRDPSTVIMGFIVAFAVAFGCLCSIVLNLSMPVTMALLIIAPIAVIVIMNFVSRQFK